MMLFIRRIPADLSRRELEALVREALKPKLWWPFGPRGAMTRCEVLAIYDKDRGERERHGLVSIVPQRAAQLVLKRLDRSKMKGKVVEVRPYVKRMYQRDRRIRGYDGRSMEDEARRDDRRRPNLVEAIESSPKVEGLHGFNREYGV